MAVFGIRSDEKFGQEFSETFFSWNMVGEPSSNVVKTVVIFGFLTFWGGSFTVCLGKMYFHFDSYFLRWVGSTTNQMQHLGLHGWWFFSIVGLSDILHSPGCKSEQMSNKT